MRRRYAILFLTLFALLYTGVYVYFIARLYDIKREMRAALKAMPEEHLMQLVLAETDFRASRVDEHEMKVNGKMYDIARFSIENGCVTVWCLHDEAEDNLLSFMDAMLRNLHQDTAPVPISMAVFTLTWDMPVVFEFSVNRKISELSLSPPYSDALRAPVLSLESPPPRA